MASVVVLITFSPFASLARVLRSVPRLISHSEAQQSDDERAKRVIFISPHHKNFPEPIFSCFITAN